MAVGGSSSTITLPAASGTGHLLILTVSYDNPNAHVASITDTSGNSYILAIKPTTWDSNGYNTEMWYAKNIAAGSTPITATVKLSASSKYRLQLYFNEYKGLDTVSPLDQISVTTSTTAKTLTSGAKTTTAPNELIFGHAEANAVDINGGSGFAVRTTFYGDLEEDKAATSIGSYSANFSMNYAVASIALMATFKAAGSTDVNQAPNVEAGSAQTITLPGVAALSGIATDDGLPTNPGKLTTTWSVFSGPGTVTFGNPASLSTTASFKTAGTYVLALTASDSLLSSQASVTITVKPAK
jgi:hypothetical protein